ncbi:unnamed protein product [Cuscuta epithymum]|uniref:Polygalacturonase n=1 Tax=Cuscuta epithymum TaxID=186058 RepID=A0AAV0C3A0_9ASTE|nr:unnamed protein product [Cuscuta epithymum]
MSPNYNKNKIILVTIFITSLGLFFSQSCVSATGSLTCNGKTDDTASFQKAWAAACAAGSPLVVPVGMTCLVGEITLEGPCGKGFALQVNGVITAPPHGSSLWTGSLQWFNIKGVEGFTLSGTGGFDGNGATGWYTASGTKPTAVRFYGSTDVTVTGIQIKNSPQAHLKFNGCTGVTVSNIKITSPGDSPNTDGIHLQNTKTVTITGTTIACGDDCVSIQTGCSGVDISKLTCGPGHGVSIGGLGKGGTQACVSNIKVSDSTFTDTLTGGRIKTWQGGSGSVSGVSFTNIKCVGVETPIMIDQFYCDGGGCKNQTAAVDVTDVTFQGFTGTYTKQGMELACSGTVPCAEVKLSAISLTASGTKAGPPLCADVYGTAAGTISPPISGCLKAGTVAKKNANSCT